MKYIIELEKKLSDIGERYYVKDTNTAVGDYVLKYLTPYTEPTEHDGCEGCRWAHQDSLYEPCKDCKGNYTDKYEPKPKKIIKRWEKYEGDFNKADEDFMNTYEGCSNCEESYACNNCFAEWLMEDIEDEE